MDVQTFQTLLNVIKSALVSIAEEEQKIAESEGFSCAGSWVAKEYMIVE